MKKLKLNLASVKEMLTKEQMKKISGGYGTPCDYAGNPIYEYYCCDGAGAVELGYIYCNEAYNSCDGNITTDYSSC